jgi:PAS domain S-box-containing protein
MKRILIVEDEAVTAKDIESTLELLGYEVTGVVDTGEEAIEKALGSSPDLILMDIKLKGKLSGIEAAAKIMQVSPVPVVYLTAFADPETLKNAKLTYPFGYLVKPFEDSQLRAAIETTLARAEMSGVLKKSRELLFSTLKSIVDGVIAADEAGRVTFMNSTAEILTGWTEKDALGLDLESVFTLTDEITGAKIGGLMEKALSKGFAGVISSHALLVPRRGEGVPVEDSTALIRDSSGKVSGIILVFRDVTEKRKVQRSRQKYVDLYENASDLFFTCDTEGAVTSINAAAVSAFGYSGKAELYAAGLEKMFTRESYEELMEAQARFRVNLSGEVQGVMQLAGCRKSGETFPIELKLTPMTRDGALVGVHGVGRDVSDKLRAEKRLKKSEERYRRLYDKTPVMLSLTDIDERLLDVNEYWLRSMGYEKREVLGRRLSDFIPGAAGDFISRTAGESKAISGLLVRLERKGGEQRECFLFCTPEKNDRDEMVGWVVAYSDITERRNAERALSTSEMLLDNIINSLDETVLVISPERKILSVNRAGEGMFGASAQELAGRSAEALHCDAANFWAYSRYIEKSFDKITPVSFEFRMKRANGESFPTEQTLSPLRSESGRLTAVVATIRDVTARRQAEETLRQKEEQLRHTQKMELVGQLISGVAHELNNPLASIVGYSQLLARKKGMSRETLEDLKLMAQSASQCRRIVENLLRFVRKEEGEISKVSPAVMVGRLLELMKYRMKKTKISEVIVEIPKDLRVYCRPQQMEQVLGNLVANAVDAMAGSSCEVKRLRITCGKEKKKVLFRVENSGPEIPEDLKEKIFTPFFTTKKASEGTGLGLALCRQIVDGHGGRIWAETPPQGGAAFVIELPSVSARPASRKAPRKKGKTISGLEILVVDDEARVGSMLERALTTSGNLVARASSLAEGKDQLGAKKFDLVISDIVLGDGTGLELYESRGSSAPPFLFMTGNVMDAPLMKHFEENKLAYLKKPFDLVDLFSEIAAVLEKAA